jgi:hypothetical protein
MKNNVYYIKKKGQQAETEEKNHRKYRQKNEK